MPKLIDFHIHPPGPGGLSTQEQAEMAVYFRGEPPPSTTEEMADYYQKLDMFGVLFAIDTETATGRPPVPNQYFADCVKRWPDTFTAFGNVDPWKGAAAVRELGLAIGREGRAASPRPVAGAPFSAPSGSA